MSIFSLKKSDGIAIISMNDASQSQNVLNQSMQVEFDVLFADIQADNKLKGLIFTSSKQDCFLAGADISMLQQINSEEEAEAASKLLHGLTQQIAELKIPTVAAIDGVCLGGGLELALAFDYRIATHNPATRIGLPEVQLGLLPGGSGTQRLPRLIALPDALDMMLTGRQLSASRAKRIALVDAVVAPEVLIEVAKKYLGKGKAKRQQGFNQKAMANPLVRKLIIAQARKKTLKASKGHYPAPLKILEVVEGGLSSSLEKGLDIEAKGFAELLMSKQSKQLVNIFFATSELKKDSGVDSQEKARKVNKVGVLGAGLMGAGIGLVSIEKAKKTVRIKDINPEGLARGIAYIGKRLDKKVARRRMPANKRDKVMSRLTGSTDYSGFANVDVVIEAVFESLDLKRAMVADIEKIAEQQGKEMILATNASAIPIAQIAEKAKHPERVVGMHYFSPVEKMPLLEIVTAEKTADWVTATAVELGKQQGKMVIVVNDGPGFYTTRILVPYIMEAVRLILEGVAITDIDKAMEDFGFPVGPIKLMDEVGIDVGSHIVTTLNDAFGERVPLIDGMDKLLKDERKGRKNQRGFYLYEGKKSAKQVDKTIYPLLGLAEPEENAMPAERIVERVLFTMLNEAAYCLDDKILRNVRDGDIGAIFGLGFPPFLGGPFRFMDSLGVGSVLATLDQLSEQHGERFNPAACLSKISKSKKEFYS